jgi:hypothetical protein
MAALSSITCVQIRVYKSHLLGVLTPTANLRKSTLESLIISGIDTASLRRLSIDG